jgi:putative addiction module CopG family antidote
MTIQVQLPEAAQTFVDEQVASGRFTDASDFIANLVEQARLHATHDHVERLLLEGLHSGEPIEIGQDWWRTKADEWARKYAGEPSS